VGGEGCESGPADPSPDGRLWDGHRERCAIVQASTRLAEATWEAVVAVVAPVSSRSVAQEVACALVRVPLFELRVL
jgi:hypothetical protein